MSVIIEKKDIKDVLNISSNIQQVVKKAREEIIKPADVINTML